MHWIEKSGSSSDVLGKNLDFRAEDRWLFLAYGVDSVNQVLRHSFLFIVFLAECPVETLVNDNDCR